MSRSMLDQPVRLRALRGRLPRLVTAALGVVLLAVATISTISGGRAAALSDLDHALAAEAASNASALNEYFDRAQSLALLLAHDSAFRQFGPGAGAAPVPRFGVAAAKEASEAMAYLSSSTPAGSARPA